MAEPDVAALVKQTEHLNLLVGSLRDEMRILSAVVLRLDDSMTALAREMRAHMARMDDWRRKLEGADE